MEVTLDQGPDTQRPEQAVPAQDCVSGSLVDKRQLEASTVLNSRPDQ
jgi:hypothetical protein